MKRVAVLLVVMIANTCAFAFEENELSGKVISVIDGNTIELMADDNDTYKIMLYGIDSPELGQNFGDKAQKFLQKMILDKNVSVKIQGKDRWGNRIGVILIDGKIDPRLELLEAGLAWTAERNPLVELESVKEKARVQGKGLWKEKDPTPPWQFRRDQTMLEPKYR